MMRKRNLCRKAISRLALLPLVVGALAFPLRFASAPAPTRSTPRPAGKIATISVAGALGSFAPGRVDHAVPTVWSVLVRPSRPVSGRGGRVVLQAHDVSGATTCQWVSAKLHLDRTIRRCGHDPRIAVRIPRNSSARARDFPITFRPTNRYGATSVDLGVTQLGVEAPVATTTASPPPPAPAAPALAFTTSGSTTWTAGTWSSFAVTTTEAAGITVTESGPLPPGVFFYQNGMDWQWALFGQAPTYNGIAGVYPITLTATDSEGQSVTQSFTLTIDESPWIQVIGLFGFWPPGELGPWSTFTSPILTESLNSYTINVLGYPVPKITESGTLPAGVTVTDNGDGTFTLAGTPSASDVGKIFDFSITASNGIGSANTDNDKALVGEWTSSNWSGYEASNPGAPIAVSAVSGSFVVPTVTCGSGENSYSSEWVGIDGFTSATVEQDGIAAGCEDGSPNYYAWYEMYGDSNLNGGNSVELLPTSYPVSPGDTITASVSVTGDNWTLRLDDPTQNWTFSTVIAFAGAAQSSAEWIEERPAICDGGSCALTALSNFGTATFTNATATVNGSNESIAAASGEPIAMWDDDATALLAVPTALDSTGESFNVNWEGAGP